MAANAITLSGNLVKDPELKVTPTKKFVVSFRIAVDDAGGKDASGFFTCQAWGDLAKNLAETLSKGQRVIVAGQLRHREFEVDGDKRSATEVLVQDAGPSMLWATAQIAKRAPAKEREPQPA